MCILINIINFKINNYINFEWIKKLELVTRVNPRSLRIETTDLDHGGNHSQGTKDTLR
jgi:hypothetical protein